MDIQRERYKDWTASGLLSTHKAYRCQWEVQELCTSLTGCNCPNYFSKMTAPATQCHFWQFVSRWLAYITCFAWKIKHSPRIIQTVSIHLQINKNKLTYFKQMSQKLNRNSHKGLLKKLTGHVVRGKFCHGSENRQEMESKDWPNFHCGKRLTVSILVTLKVQCFSILSMIWRANKSKSSSAYCMLGVWTSTETMRNSSPAKQMLWVSICVDEELASYTCWSFTCWIFLTIIWQNHCMHASITVQTQHQSAPKELPQTIRVLIHEPTGRGAPVLETGGGSRPDHLRGSLKKEHCTNVLIFPVSIWQLEWIKSRV